MLGLSLDLTISTCADLGKLFILAEPQFLIYDTYIISISYVCIDNKVSAIIVTTTKLSYFKVTWVQINDFQFWVGDNLRNLQLSQDWLCSFLY